MNKKDKILLDTIKSVANSHGWTIAIHGSTKRDLDIIATPWIENASLLKTLLNDIITTINYQRIDPDTTYPDKPLGRYAVLLKHPNAVVSSQKNGKTGWNPKVLDISFIDIRQIF